MPLVLDDRRLLPPGMHEATLDEVEETFGRFQRTDCRMTLFRKLKAWVAAVKRTGWECVILLDGSFVMGPVDEPNDIDVILVMPRDWDLTADLRPFEYNVVSKRYTKREYSIEVYPVLPGSGAEQQFMDLFAQVRIEWCQQFQWPPDSKKGIVRIVS
jgi:hypothetical protein